METPNAYTANRLQKAVWLKKQECTLDYLSTTVQKTSLIWRFVKEALYTQHPCTYPQFQNLAEAQDSSLQQWGLAFLPSTQDTVMSIFLNNG